MSSPKNFRRVWRHVPPDAEPLNVGEIWKHSEGRWNRRGEYACLYTALTRRGALAELEKARRLYGQAVGDRDLVSIDINHLEPVLDLTQVKEYRRAARAAGESPDTALLTADNNAAKQHCRRVADQARSEGYTALLVPSAAADGETNLIIYFDVVAPKQLDIQNGPDRERVSAA